MSYLQFTATEKQRKGGSAPANTFLLKREVETIKHYRFQKNKEKVEEYPLRNTQKIRHRKTEKRWKTIPYRIPKR